MKKNVNVGTRVLRANYRLSVATNTVIGIASLLSILYTDTPQFEHFQLTGGKTEIISLKREQWNDDGGRILLGDNTCGGAPMLRPIMVQCVGFWISTGISRTVKRRYSATVCDGISKVALNRYCIKRTTVHRLPWVVRAAIYRGLTLYGYTVDHSYLLHEAESFLRSEPVVS